MIKKLFTKLEDNKDIIFGIMVFVLIVFFAVSICPKQLQNDTFYTVTIGKLISENGIDSQDHFSWHNNLPYTYPHWLYDLGMYHIYNIGGWDGIYLSTCVFASILGLCIYFTNSRLTNNKIISFIVTIAVLYLIRGYIAARAQLVTFILFILLVYNIERFLQPYINKGNKELEGRKEKNSKQKLVSKKSSFLNVIAILIIQTLIANLHVAVWPFTFVLYLPYIAEYLVSELIELVLYKKIKQSILKSEIKSMNKKLHKKSLQSHERQKIEARLQKYTSILNKDEQKIKKIKAKREENAKNAYKLTITKNTRTRWLILIMIIAIFTGFLTPLGKTPFTYTYLTLKGNTMNNINEHLPLTLAKNTPMMCTIIVLLALLTFTRVKIKISDLLMIGGLGYLMFSSRRQQSMFVLIGSIAFTRMVTNLIKLHYPIKDLNKKFFNAFTAFISIVLVLSLGLHLYSKIRKDKYINKSTYPVEASEWILENLDVNKIKLFNEYNYGSYLLYKGIPVFVDSRADLYAPEFNTPDGFFTSGQDIFGDFIDSSSINRYYGDIFEKYGITHVILYKGSKINMLITNADSEKYKKIYPTEEDSKDNFVIYEVVK